MYGTVSRTLFESWPCQHALPILLTGLQGFHCSWFTALLLRPYPQDTEWLLSVYRVLTIADLQFYHLSLSFSGFNLHAEARATIIFQTVLGLYCACAKGTNVRVDTGVGQRRWNYGTITSTITYGCCNENVCYCHCCSCSIWSCRCYVSCRSCKTLTRTSSTSCYSGDSW